MNYSIISYIIGWILNFEALFMLLPCIVAMIYKESSGWAFVLAILLCLLFGIPLTQRKPKNKIFLHKRRFCHCGTELDRAQYHGSAAVYIQRLHSQCY